MQALETINGQHACDVDPAAVVAQLRSWIQARLGNGQSPHGKGPANVQVPRHHAHGESEGSRRPSTATGFAWQEAATRRLDDRAYPVVFVGVRQVRGAWCSLALGVDLKGNRHVLGGRDDARSAVLLGELAIRGLGAEDDLLIITDGAAVWTKQRKNTGAGGLGCNTVFTASATTFWRTPLKQSIP